MTTVLERPATSPSPGAVAGAGVDAARRYLHSVTAGEFDWRVYLSHFPAPLLQDAKGRRTLCKRHPLLFALLYLRRHLTDKVTGEITLSEFHLDLLRQAESWWVQPTEPMQFRDAYVAPRESGKTTWLFLILPLWAACMRYTQFVGAFANTSTQAELHLSTFRSELEDNALLRNDYPKTCRPKQRPSGVTTSDTRNMLITHQGFVFAAKGIDSSSLGMKVGDRRPDLLILDDIEPDEGNYSDYQAEKRLSTMIDAIFGMNLRARVVISGTVTMPDSIIHQLVKSAQLAQSLRPGFVPKPAKWVTDEKIQTHHYQPIVTDPETGEQRSIWPAKWSLAWLLSQRHTRAYKKNFSNDPMGNAGGYWTIEDFTPWDPEDSPLRLTRCMLSVDPAVTTKRTSDFTGLAVIAFDPMQRKCVVLHAEAVKLPGLGLANRAQILCNLFPMISGLYIETNQGGDVIGDVFKDVGVKVHKVNQSVRKEVRASKTLNYYQRGQVLHAAGLTAAEEQMVSFPNPGVHDDIVDAITTGVLRFMDPPKDKGPKPATIEAVRYK